MTRPTKVNILGHTYTIKWDKAEVIKEKADNGADTLGFTRNLEQLIVIDPDNHPDQQRDTLVHEMLHAISWCAVVHYLPPIEHSTIPGASHINPSEDDAEEHVVNQLAPHLRIVLGQNPGVVAWLVGKD